MPDPVLVVAADLHFAKVIERACASQGMESISADEGESALVALEFEKPIAIICENDLRDRMGTDLCKEIRGRPEGEALPIIILAGPMMPASELTSRAVKVGATCCLDSSVPAEHIAIGLRALLEGDDSVLSRLVNGESLDDANEPTQLDEDVEPPKSSRTADDPRTRVQESDDEPASPKRGEASIDIEIDDRIITGGRIKSPPPKPKHPPADPRSGTLNNLPFARLLAELKRDFATGALELAREKVKKTIWLSEGVPVSAKSNAMGETLGAVLVKMGKLSESQRSESVEKMQKEKKRHGEVLVEMGIVKQKDVNSALQAQARAKVINCFAWDDGAYDFKPAEELPADQPELKMSFGALIAAGVKQRYDLPRLRKVLLPHIGETPRFDDAMSEVFAELKLEEAERKVIESLKGRRSLAEVLALSDMDELELHRVLVTASFAGVVAFHPEGNVTRQYRLEKNDPKSEPSQIGKPQGEKTGGIARDRERERRMTAEPSIAMRDVEGEKTNVQDEEPPDVFGKKEGGLDLGAELGRELAAEFGDDDEEEERKPAPKRAAKAPNANGKAAAKVAVPADPSKEDTGPKPAEVDDRPEPTEPPETRLDPEVEAKIHSALTRMTGQNFYERLGVSTDAVASAIKSAYLRLAKEYHPDRLVQDGGAGLKSKADELFAMISEAYHTLTDEKKRKKYDDEVLRGIKDDATDEANAILNAEHQFLKGERLLKAGNVAKAHEAFATAVELYPKESEYQACYGWTMFKLHHPGDMPKANEGEKVIRNALTMNARNDKAHLFLGQIARIKGNVDDAKKHFDKALEIQPDNVDAQRELRVLDMRESKKGGIGGLFRGGKK